MAGAQEHWEFLFNHTLLFAHYQVQRLRWRGVHGGIMTAVHAIRALRAVAPNVDFNAVFFMLCLWLTLLAFGQNRVP
jgi:hypothetical protein